MSANDDEFLFDDLEPKTKTVRLHYPDRTEVYVLHQATEDAAVKAENHRHRHSKVTEDGKLLAVDGLFDGPAYLVSLCVRDDKGLPVTEAKVRSWRPDVVRKLHGWVVENSGMAGADTVAALESRIAQDTKAVARLRALANGNTAKNSPGGGEATSA